MICNVYKWSWVFPFFFIYIKEHCLIQFPYALLFLRRVAAILTGRIFSTALTTQFFFVISTYSNMKSINHTLNNCWIVPFTDGQAMSYGINLYRLNLSLKSFRIFECFWNKQRWLNTISIIIHLKSIWDLFFKISFDAIYFYRVT